MVARLLTLPLDSDADRACRLQYRRTQQRAGREGLNFERVQESKTQYSSIVGGRVSLPQPHFTQPLAQLKPQCRIFSEVLSQPRLPVARGRARLISEQSDLVQ